MDQTSPISDALLHARPMPPAASPRRPRLALVETRLRLVHPAGEIPQEWRAALGDLLGWAGIDAEIVPAEQPRGLKRLADWAVPGAAPLFAPWLGWSPAAFQHGGLAHLPKAQFVVSYLVDHPRAAIDERHEGRRENDAQGRDLPMPRVSRRPRGRARRPPGRCRGRSCARASAG